MSEEIVFFAGRRLTGQLGAGGAGVRVSKSAAQTKDPNLDDRCETVPMMCRVYSACQIWPWCRHLIFPPMVEDPHRLRAANAE